ncbi:hypothetical protein Pcinc_008668 [Petrolisthes cinctipes]|uniref:J domain-containing protein n=1 Tax=Petrolisthes cinctipes TaxID=88211 RepID=A0AAE1G8B5_PETCI|nr:hypothetical protein Pcinc_008668 [Petrolisthes cinctipes]
MLALHVQTSSKRLAVKWPNLWIPVQCLHSREKDYLVYYKELELKGGSDQAAVRDAFLKLAKKVHPDSGHSQANAEKFQKIDNAYRKLLEKFSSERWNVNKCEGEFGLYYEQKRKWREMEREEEEEEEEEEKEKDYGIKHTAPQHRQYLSYEGIGIGTPSQRQRQYTKVRAQRATSSVVDYRIKRISEGNTETAMVDRDRKEARKIRTRYGIDRIVDDVIQEAMARGDFDNLSLAGKPLPERNINPYVDTTTQKINEHLINNGFAPEWVMVDKEVRQKREAVRQRLRQARQRLGPLPLTPDDQTLWQEMLDQLAATHIRDLNRHINKLNFLVPLMTQQLTHFPLKREAEQVLREGETREDVERRRREKEEIERRKEEENRGWLFGIFRLFRRI